MANNNTITIVGNVTREPELRFTANGRSQLTLGLAVNHRYPDRSRPGEWVEETSFFNVVCWADLAENVSASVQKGSRIIVMGRLRQRSWETDNNEKRSVVEVIAEEVGPSLRWATARSAVPSVRARARAPPRPRRALRSAVGAPPAAVTTTSARSRSRWRKIANDEKDEGAAADQRRVPKKKTVDPHERADRLDRLQGRQPAPAVHVGAGEDPRPASHRQLAAAAGGGGEGDPHRTRDGAAALQRPPGDAAQQGRPARPRRPW